MKQHSPPVATGRLGCLTNSVSTADKATNGNAKSIGNRPPKTTRPVKFTAGGHRLSGIKTLAAAAASHVEDRPVPSLARVRRLERPLVNDDVGDR
jgi:hypothetical protein